jgi:hypothetical protein
MSSQTGTSTIVLRDTAGYWWRRKCAFKDQKKQIETKRDGDSTPVIYRPDLPVYSAQDVRVFRYKCVVAKREIST